MMSRLLERITAETKREDLAVTDRSANGPVYADAWSEPEEHWDNDNVDSSDHE